MAADGLIDQYVRALRSRLGARRDRDDLVDEVLDHLLSTTERLEALGIDPQTAARRALARFGEPKLVASLLSDVPSKGNLMSLFFSRHLPALAVAASVTWVAALAVAVYGHTDLLMPWTQSAYLAASAVTALACLLTTTVLVGLNLRATGELDGATIAIAVTGALSVVAAALLSWFVAIWVPLLAIAVVWTLARSWATHAGSRPFSAIMLVLMPLLALAAIATTVVGQVTQTDNAVIGWLTFSGLAIVLIAALVDLAVRLGRRTARAKAAVAS